MKPIAVRPHGQGFAVGEVEARMRHQKPALEIRRPHHVRTPREAATFVWSVLAQLSRETKEADVDQLSLLEAPEDPTPVMEEIEQRDTEWLDGLRGELQKLYEYRVASWGLERGPAFVTADDARRLMKQYPRLRVPLGTSNNALGALFRAGGWRRIGYVRSLTQGSHGNLIGQWAHDPA